MIKPSISRFFNPNLISFGVEIELDSITKKLTTITLLFWRYAIEIEI